MKTMLIALLLSTNSLAQSRYCDAVVTTSVHDWGIEFNVVSTASPTTDCFFGITITPASAPSQALQPNFQWLLSRVETSPVRFLTDSTCNTSGMQLNCGIGLKAGASATILGVLKQRVDDVTNANCYTVSAQNNSFLSGIVGLEGRRARLICLPR
jgi:hypothetical protein